jgi:hypothetical protein
MENITGDTAIGHALAELGGMDFDRSLLESKVGEEPDGTPFTLEDFMAEVHPGYKGTPYQFMSDYQQELSEKAKDWYMQRLRELDDDVFYNVETVQFGFKGSTAVFVTVVGRGNFGGEAKKYVYPIYGVERQMREAFPQSSFDVHVLALNNGGDRYKESIKKMASDFGATQLIYQAKGT